MHTVEPDVDRPDGDLVSAFEGVPSSIVSDVTGNAGVAMDAGIGPVYRGAETAGTALTVKATPGDNLVINRAITMAEPGTCSSSTATGTPGRRTWVDSCARRARHTTSPAS